MKNKFIPFLFTLCFSIFLFFSCGKDKNTEKETDSLAPDSTKFIHKTLPEFTDSVVNSYIINYTNYVDAYLAASKTGDKEKLQELRNQSMSFIKQANEVSRKITRKKEVVLYKRWVAEQNQKIEAHNK